MIKLDTKGGLSLIVDDWDGPFEVFLDENEARNLMNDLYDYFENKDREALARILTRRKEPGIL